MGPAPPPPRYTMYCGRCGAPLAPGAVFCGRCGTPVALPAVAPAAMAPPAPYVYPQAPRAPYTTSRRIGLPQVMIAGGLIVVLLIVGAVVSAIALSQYVNGTKTKCTSNCGPKFVTPLPEEASYRSSAFRYQVNYASDWSVRSQDSAGIALGTKLGSVQVAGLAAADDAQVLQSTVNGLPTSRFQDVTLVSNVKGAHIGDHDGLGSVYSANLVGGTQTATRVRLAVIVATHNGVTIVVLAVDPADPKGSPNGMPEGQLFDYFCTEIVWG